MLNKVAADNTLQTETLTATNSAATAQGDSSFCGGYTYSYSLLNPSDTFPFTTPKFWIDGNQIKFTSDSIADATAMTPSVMDLVFTAVLTDYSTLAGTAAFQISIVDACESTVISASVSGDITGVETGGGVVETRIITTSNSEAVSRSDGNFCGGYDITYDS